FFSSRRRHTSFSRDWSSDVCSSDLRLTAGGVSLVLLAALLGCGATGAAPGAVGTIEDGFRIGVLLPDRRAERYEAHDRPAIAREIGRATGRDRMSVLVLRRNSV